MEVYLAPPVRIHGVELANSNSEPTPPKTRRPTPPMAAAAASIRAAGPFSKLKGWG